jgi:hypothetical protein
VPRIAWLHLLSKKHTDELIWQTDPKEIEQVCLLPGLRALSIRTGRQGRNPAENKPPLAKTDIWCTVLTFSEDAAAFRIAQCPASLGHLRTGSYRDWLEQGKRVW